MWTLATAESRRRLHRVVLPGNRLHCLLVCLFAAFMRTAVTVECNRTKGRKHLINANNMRAKMLKWNSHEIFGAKIDVQRPDKWFGCCCRTLHAAWMQWSSVYFRGSGTAHNANTSNWHIRHIDGSERYAITVCHFHDIWHFQRFRVCSGHGYYYLCSRTVFGPLCLRMHIPTDGISMRFAMNCRMDANELFGFLFLPCITHFLWIFGFDIRIQFKTSVCASALNSSIPI